MYLEKRDPKYRPALDKAIQFVLDSQYPIGGWPQRYPLRTSIRTSFLTTRRIITFNDDVAAENIDFLLQCYQTLGDARLLDPIRRGMNAFIVTAAGPAAAGLGAAVHARLQAGRRAHVRAERRSSRTRRRATSSC